jgi:glycosyltransferase involved in cell wall biosynthesis
MSVPNVKKGWLVGQHRVCFTMWETSVLDPVFVRWLGQYDQILVPCEHNVELFSQHHHDVRVVPLGVDHKFWRPQPRVVDGPFRFHAGGSLWRRKGLDVVVRAFKALNLPDAVLHIKAAPHAADTPRGGFPPNVVLHRKWMSLEEQRDWFNQADCFIAASRGEGFGLMPLQAIALGVPTIVSETSGQVQFADCAWGRVPVSKVTADTVGEWDEPDQGVLEELMMLAYRNRHTIREEAELNIPQDRTIRMETLNQKTPCRNPHRRHAQSCRTSHPIRTSSRTSPPQSQRHHRQQHLQDGTRTHLHHPRKRL